MKEQLQQLIGLEILENEILAKYTTFKVGGPAKYLVKVNNKKDLYKAIKAVHDLRLSFFILGGGSNVLISDKGFDGLVIKLSDGELENPKNSEWRVFAGHWLGSFINKIVEQGFGGLEFSANIPGTVGGAVFGNAGAYGQGVGDFVKQVEIICIENKEVNLKVLTKEECEFAYRESIFKKHKNWIISEIVFKLNKDENSAEKLQQINEEWKKRLCSQPLNLPSAGCSFKNIVYTENLNKFKDWQIKGKLPAGKFIDEAGLKDFKAGGAKVSEVHANFVVNFDNATASDVTNVIKEVKSKVKEKFGVELEEEVQSVGEF